MKVIKLDRRYAGSKKWKYALHFGRRRVDQLKRLQYARLFAKIYGKDCWFNPDRKMFGPEPMWLYSEDWHDDNKRGRIYFNKESDLTAIELVRD
jgi:hypothetical protein